MIYKRKHEAINAGSMADIAFLLLIFFLVTTTLDVDAGIQRKLPPIQEEPEPDRSEIHKRNIFTVLVNAKGELYVEGEYLSLSDLREKAKAFINNNGDGTCQYCRDGQRSPLSSDNPGKAVISLQNDRATPYKVYVAVQNELAAAYNQLRDQMAQERFGKALNSLNEDQKLEIKMAYPQLISEAEPVGFNSKD